jgi:N-methylhydantoinase A
VSYIVAADTGGTFTDLVVYDTESGRVRYTKSLTTYDDLVDGVLACVRATGLDLAHADIVKFGTTLVINTYVQRNGARTALVTTAGFRDVLEIRRGNRPIPFDLRYERDPVLIERDLRFTVSERIAADGSVLHRLDPTELDSVAATIRESGVEAVAVSFLNAYASDVHEAAAAQQLRDRLPGVYVSAGTELSREWYEYERTSTVAANAYVGPKMEDYVRRLETALRHAGFAKSFFLMSSNGGVFSPARARRQPVMLVESGPVGGCIGAGAYADALGLDRLIAFDMGGTTAKCALLENGRFDVKSPYYVGGYDRGFPVRGSVLDIVEVGTGGGSIAWLDGLAAVKVGPRSAGSTPGPVCYGRGGTEPTVTDANLVLGRIGAASFLGGRMSLDAGAAERAIGDLATRLGFSGRSGLDEMAQGILTLSTLSMASAIRRITVERGLDPRDFSLFAFGGGGPLHAGLLARELAVPHLVIPPEPGNFSALGMILADARIDESRTLLRPLSAGTMAEIEREFRRIEEPVGQALRRETGSANALYERQAELSFRGQKHSIRVPIGARLDVDAIRADFEAAYRRRYGHVEQNAPIQFMALVVTALAGTERPRLERLRPELAVDRPPAGRERSVYFAESGGRLDTPVFQRNHLPGGFEAAGPAVIEEYGSTTVIGPRDRFAIGRLGEIHIRFD